MTLDRLFRKAAQSVVADWCIEDGLDDLTQDLWVWYLERPGTQQKLSEMEAGEKVSVVKKAAHQIVSRKVLEDDVASGRLTYSSEAVKDCLKGKSTNKYLKRLVPRALDSIAPQYAEAIKNRYETGLLPCGESEQQALKFAHKALTAQVNVLMLTEEPKGRNAVFPETRRSKGGHSDPTLDAVLGLLSDKADKRIQTVNTHKEPTGDTSYRVEMLSVFDDWFARTIPPEGTRKSYMSLTDNFFNGGHRSEMYRAQVAPELFPNEKPMLIENWSAEDREMYCGGNFTKGYND